MRRKLIPALTLVLFVGACGGGGGLAADLKLNDDPQSVLLVVRDEGGFVPLDFQVRQGPRLVLLRDGTLITTGPMIELYPGPMLIPYQQVKLDDETMLFVLEELDTLGFVNIVDETNNEAAQFVADASTTVMTFFNQDGPHRFGVYGLDMGGLGGGVEITDPRVSQLANLVAELQDAGFSSPAGPYEPAAIQVVAGISEFSPDPAFANVLPWSLPVTYEEMAESGIPGWRCATFEGSEMETLLAEFSAANQLTTWEAGGTEYALAVRPLFPGEEPCAALIPSA